jgi:hypothetical protein
MAHSRGEHFRCNIGESGGVFKWPTQVVEILGAILVNPVGYFSGPQAHSSGCGFGCSMGESGGIIKWPTQVVEILGAILVNWMGYLS